MEAAVFLDRDNTLIRNDGDLGEPDAVRLIDGVAEGLRTLRAAGYRLIVVTNQAGVARGAFTEDAVDAVHQRIAALVDEASASRDLIERFYYCPYHPEAPLEEYRRDHSWRKPGPGMLMQAARDLELDLARSWMVGDQPRDVEAGRSAGCRTVLVSGGDDTGRDEAGRAARPTATAPTFPGAVEAILAAGDTAGSAETGGATAVASGRDNALDTPGDQPGDEPGDNPNDNPGPSRRQAAATPDLRATVTALTEELRSARLRRAEFSAMRLAGGMCQLLAILLALIGLLQLGSTELFLKWMVGATLAQLATITIMLLDARG